MTPAHPTGMEAGIAAALLQDQLPFELVVTEPSAVAALSRTWNAQITARPSIVAWCRTAADVQAAISAIRDGGLLVDLSLIRQVTGEARVAGGATVSDVLDAARPHGQAAAVGTVSSVGFAGLTLGGGYGTLIGVIGLGVDNLLPAEVVLADGRIVTADRDHEPDLFWSLRGGGNFGVVTEIRRACTRWPWSPRA